MDRPRPSHRRPPWIALARRGFLAAAVAVATVLLASRINPPDPAPAVVLGQPCATDEILPDLLLDDRSFPLAIESIRKVARSRIILDTPALHRACIDMGELPPFDAPPYAPLRLRNVRLGSLLAMLLKSFGSCDAECQVQCSTGRDTITLGARRAIEADIISRVHDIQDLVFEYRAWREPFRQPMPAGGSGGGPPTDPDYAMARSLDAIIEEVMPVPIAGINGRCYVEVNAGLLRVETTLAGHHQVERLLTLLRRGDSHEARLKEPSP